LAKKVKKKESGVDSYRHEKETRKNVVPVGLASYDTSKSKPKKYEYDPHLDPQLMRNRTFRLILNFELLTGSRSLPFKLGKEKRIAVKVIDHRGNEVMVVREMG
jgi:hypothetical protein